MENLIIQMEIFMKGLLVMEKKMVKGIIFFLMDQNISV